VISPAVAYLPQFPEQKLNHCAGRGKIAGDDDISFWALMECRSCMKKLESGLVFLDC
jgi:hypothetical protein